MYKKIVGLLSVGFLLWALPAFGAVQSVSSDMNNIIDKNQPDKVISCTGSSNVVNSGRFYALHFSLNGLSVPAERITSAVFKISSNNGQGNFVLQPITSGWSVNSLTWNLQPTVSPTLYQQEFSPQSYIRFRFNITDLVKNWINNPAENLGLFLRPGVDGNNNIASSEDYFVCSGGSGSPLTLNPSLDIEYCIQDEWSCSDFNVCSADGTKTRTCDKTYDCVGIDTPSPVVSATCAPIAPTSVPTISQEFFVDYDNTVENLNPQRVARCSMYGSIGSVSSYSGNTHRYLGKINFGAPLLPTNRIARATFKINEVSSSWDDDTNYILQKITSGWSPLSVTWGNQPAVDYTMSKANSGSYGAVSFDVTDIYKDWLVNSQSNYGVLVRKAVENNSFNSHQGSFGCANYSNYPPRVIVEYCTGDAWDCTSYTACTAAGQQTRTCTKTFDCPDVDTPSPIITQSCTPPITCVADIWECSDWNICGANGIQSRTCNKTFDCSIANTPSPSNQQTCLPPIVLAPLPPVVPAPVVPPVTPTPIPEIPPVIAPTPTLVPDDIFDVNIIKSTVQLVCEQGKVRIYGSGTVIKSDGTILTNRHVIEGEGGAFAPKCYVGFTSDPNEDPIFTDIAIPVAVSADEDIAKLRISNSSQIFYDWIDISHSSVNSSRFGGKIKILGYPAIGGSSLTYSSGDFSGFGSKSEGVNNYIKTTAVIEHGNSGGGSYTDSGSFVGIPTFVRKGTLNVLGFVLSVNKINSWLSSAKENIKFSKSLTKPPVDTVAYLENIIDLTPPDLSNVRVAVNKKITRQPKFTVSGVEDVDSDVVGYYYYFGTNSRANPLAKGKFSRFATYTPVALKSYGTYYFIFVSKDSKGNISESYTTTYSYTKAKK